MKKLFISAILAVLLVFNIVATLGCGKVDNPSGNPDDTETDIGSDTIQVADGTDGTSDTEDVTTGEPDGDDSTYDGTEDNTDDSESVSTPTDPPAGDTGSDEDVAIGIEGMEAGYKIDGVIDSSEWGTEIKNYGTHTWWFRHDAENLYIAARISGAGHVNNTNLQIYVSTNKEDVTDVAKSRKAIAEWDESGNLTWYNGSWGMVFTLFENAAAHSDGKSITYEVKVPWSELLESAPKSGDSIYIWAFVEAGGAWYHSSDQNQTAEKYTIVGNQNVDTPSTGTTTPSTGTTTPSTGTTTPSTGTTTPSTGTTTPSTGTTTPSTGTTTPSTGNTGSSENITNGIKVIGEGYKIDGIINSSEWGASIKEYESHSWWFRHDAENLYVAARITSADDIKNTNLQIYISTNKEDATDAAKSRKAIVEWNGSGNLTWYNGSWGAVSKLLENAVAHSDGMYITYEVKIPWSELLDAAPKSGDSIYIWTFVEAGGAWYHSSLENQTSEKYTLVDNQNVDTPSTGTTTPSTGTTTPSTGTTTPSTGTTTPSTGTTTPSTGTTTPSTGTTTPSTGTTTPSTGTTTPSTGTTTPSTGNTGSSENITNGIKVIGEGYKIDGIINSSEWGASIKEYESHSWWFRHDAENLYVAARITSADDIKNTNLQIYISTNKEDATNAAKSRKAIVEWNGSGNLTWYNGSWGAVSKLLENAVAHSDGMYITYEVKIPWSELLDAAPKSGDSIYIWTFVEAGGAWYHSSLENQTSEKYTLVDASDDATDTGSSGNVGSDVKLFDPTTDTRKGVAVNIDQDAIHYVNRSKGIGTDAKSFTEICVKWFEQYYVDCGVSDILYCINDTVPSDSRKEAYEFYQDYLNGDGENLPDDYLNIAKLHHTVYTQYKVDPYEIWIEMCRENGINPWLSFRMNDVHSTNAGYGYDDFVAKAIENGWLVGTEAGWGDWYKWALDYSVPEVRTYYLTYIDEMLGKYDVHGIELDFMREIICFKNNTVDNCKYINSFMEEVDKIVKKHEKAYGHDIKVMVRLSRDIDQNRYFGMDVRYWAQNGWVDVLVPTSAYGGTDSDMPIEAWNEALKEFENIEVWAGLENHVRTQGENQTLSTLAGFTSMYLGRGADKMYLFNMFNSSKAAYKLCSSLEYAHKVLKRSYVVTSQNNKPIAAGITGYAPLPLRVSAGVESTPLSIFHGRVNESQNTYVYLGIANCNAATAEGAGITVKYNGVVCEYAGTAEPSVTATGAYQCMLAFKIPNTAVIGSSSGDITVSAGTGLIIGYVEMVNGD